MYLLEVHVFDSVKGGSCIVQKKSPFRLFVFESSHVCPLDNPGREVPVFCLPDIVSSIFVAQTCVTNYTDSLSCPPACRRGYDVPVDFSYCTWISILTINFLSLLVLRMYSW